jgi:DNA-binding transcriptional LysR family regulator
MLPTVAVAGELRRGDLVVLPWHPDPPTLHTQAVRLARRAPTPALTALLDLARTQWAS